MLEPRSSYILPNGVTPKVLRSRTTKAIGEIRRRIESLSFPYIEVDNSIEGEVSKLMAAFDDFERHIADTQKYLESAA